MYKELLEQNIGNFIPESPLSAAINYAVLFGGKRFRASLCYSIVSDFGQDVNYAHSGAAALEFIHAYSLVHDDLPALDNDNLRRKKPTLHKKFNEETAILAGDALQSLAFVTISNDALLSSVIKNKLLRLLSKASFDMVIGQQLDISGQVEKLDDLIYLHSLKTGSLIKASMLMGATIAKVNDNNYKLLTNIANSIGLAYQIQDDTLDLLTSKQTGKSNVSDDKITFLSFLSATAAKKYYNDLYDKALADLNKLTINMNMLHSLIKIMQNRIF